MRRFWLIFSQAVTVAVALVFVLETFKPAWLGSRATVTVIGDSPAGGARPAALTSTGAPGSYAPAARRAAPSVVSVIASKSAQRSPHRSEPWFKRFFGDGDEPVSGMGSAVIVSTDGYLLTNNHVVEHSDDIEVMLGDGQRSKARIVGTDPDSDLAVLKVETLPGGRALPAVSFGDAEALQVGDVVLAIGNPFNVGQTVTSGIVSAIGRSGLGLNTFENFIQTDAAINPGNSGGALIDVQGQLLGINTAIYSRSGGSMGIGFAIPVSTARQVLDGLIRDGVVTRGWIGVQPSDLTPELAESLKLKVDHGVLITGVLENGPASAAGMKAGDVVLDVAGRAVASTSQLLNAVAALKPQATVAIAVQRSDKLFTLKVKVAQRPKVRASE
jgi:Do/DeqQ family serine protease